MASLLRRFSLSSALGRFSKCNDALPILNAWKCPSSIELRTKLSLNLPLGMRGIVTEEFFRMDAHKEQVARTKKFHGAAKENFMKRLDEYCTERKTPIFLEDVLTAIKFSETDADFDLSLKALQIYHEESGKDKFTVGPVFFRQLYLQNKSDYVLRLLEDPVLPGMLLDSMAAVTVCSQLLYAAGHYEQVLALNSHKDRQGSLVSVAFMGASAMQLNTAEAYERSRTQADAGVIQASYDLTRVMAYLAYQQKDPAAVFQILNRSGATTRNFTKQLKVMCYIDHGRIEDAVLLFVNSAEIYMRSAMKLKNASQQENQSEEAEVAAVDSDAAVVEGPCEYKMYWTRGVVDALDAAVEKSGEGELKERYSEVRQHMDESALMDRSLKEEALDITPMLRRIMGRLEKNKHSNSNQWTQAGQW